MIRIVSNLPRLPREWAATTGDKGVSIGARTHHDFLAHRDPEVIWVVNCDPALTLRLGARRLLEPNSLPPLIAVDLVLRRPARLIDHASVLARRIALRGVSHFIHYFRDVRGLDEVFGIGADRSSFIPFKANLAGKVTAPISSDGEYVLCFGRSLRDFDTFFSSVESLPYPAAIAHPHPGELAAHGARFTRELNNLPGNVRVLPDDGSDSAQIRIIRDAKIVVLPILRRSIVASGISTCLNAMLLGKCVIGSEGPGMSDVFGEEVLVVPPENAVALGDAIRRAWEDDLLRGRTAEAGHAYAVQQGGEPELYGRIINCVAEWRHNSSK